MKASIKFREDQKPLFRAKVPLSILGFPFQSGIVAGDSKELCLNLGTFFDSGPSLKIGYRPNDPTNPFSLVFRTGIGHFGSPISSPMTMSAELNLIGNQNPSFFVHFKPSFGDFRIKKSQSSDFVKSIKAKSNGILSEDDGSIEVIDTPVAKENEMFSGKRIDVFPSDSPVAKENWRFSGRRIELLQAESHVGSLIGGLLNGTEASAKTVLPLMNRAVVSFRWGFRFPAADEAAARRNPTAGISSIQNFPLLVMNKIGIEHVAKDDSKDTGKLGARGNLPGGDDVAETCLAVKRQLELIQAENGMLRKTVDDLRSEFSAVRLGSPAAGGGLVREGDRGGKFSGGRGDWRSGGDKKSSELNGFGGKVKEGDANEELKKA